MPGQYLTTAQAAAFLGYKTKAGLLMAMAKGKIKPAGRRGGTGTYVWLKSDLDCFLTGGVGSLYGRSENGLETPCGVRDRGDFDAEGGLEDAGREVVRPGPRDGSQDGEAPGGEPVLVGGIRKRRKGLVRGRARADSHGRSYSNEDAIRGIREIALRAKGGAR